MTISVIVTIVECGRSLEFCLRALRDQVDPPALEILVPWDDSVPEVAALASAFPSVRFLPMGHVATAADPHRPRGQHELFDRRRSAGLAAASGDIVAMIEDRGVPTPEWARTVARLHAELPHAVIGGAVENGIDRLPNWAVYYCDFTRYQRPLEAGPAHWVTDVNVSYKRSAIERTEPLWRHRYHETVVHDALAQAGETLYLTPELVVEQMRNRVDWGTLLRERLDWGRLFAYTRMRDSGPLKRVAYLAAAPLIPAVVLARQARLHRRKGSFRRYAAAAPAVALLLAVWALGEAVGYATGKP
jgi:hypothetical protein